MLRIPEYNCSTHQLPLAIIRHHRLLELPFITLAICAVHSTKYWLCVVVLEANYVVSIRKNEALRSGNVHEVLTQVVT